MFEESVLLSEGSVLLFEESVLLLEGSVHLCEESVLLLEGSVLLLERSVLLLEGSLSSGSEKRAGGLGCVVALTNVAKESAGWAVIAAREGSA